MIKDLNNVHEALDLKPSITNNTNTHSSLHHPKAPPVLSFIIVLHTRLDKPINAPEALTVTAG